MGRVPLRNQDWFDSGLARIHPGTPPVSLGLTGRKDGRVYGETGE